MALSLVSLPMPTKKGWSPKESIMSELGFDCGVLNVVVEPPRSSGTVAYFDRLQGPCPCPKLHNRTRNSKRAPWTPKMPSDITWYRSFAAVRVSLVSTISIVASFSYSCCILLSVSLAVLSQHVTATEAGEPVQVCI